MRLCDGKDSLQASNGHAGLADGLHKCGTTADTKRRHLPSASMLMLSSYCLRYLGTLSLITLLSCRGYPCRDHGKSQSFLSSAFQRSKGTMMAWLCHASLTSGEPSRYSSKHMIACLHRTAVGKKWHSLEASLIHSLSLCFRYPCSARPD